MQIIMDSVTDSPDFPDSTDVIVIGGGIIGVCSAYELARKGMSVTLMEKGIIGGEQSGRNWGWCRQQNRNQFELPMAMHALKRWEELGKESGEDTGFRRTGIVYTTTSPKDLEKWEAWGRGAREIGFVSHMLNAKQAKDRSPGTRSDWIGGVFSPDDGRAEPSMAAPAIARALQKQGGYVFQRCAVRGLDIKAGAVQGVWTERGLVKASTVVLAGGAWSARFCRRHKINLPTANVVGTVAQTNQIPEVVRGCLSTPNVAVRRRLDGSYTVAIPGIGRIDLAPLGMRNAVKFRAAYRSTLSKKLSFRLGKPFLDGPEAMSSWTFDGPSPFEQHRTWEPRPDKQLAEEAISSFGQEYPELGDLRLARCWAGSIDTTPDLIPVISPVPVQPGLIIASGFSGHGFGIGPGAGRLIADIVADDMPIVDPTPYRLNRFFDGSKLKQPEFM